MAEHVYENEKHSHDQKLAVKEQKFLNYTSLVSED